MASYSYANASTNSANDSYTFPAWSGGSNFCRCVDAMIVFQLVASVVTRGEADKHNTLPNTLFHLVITRRVHGVLFVVQLVALGVNTLFDVTLK